VSELRVEPAWFSVRQAVIYTGLAERTLRRELEKGSIKCRLYTTGDGKSGRRRRLISKASIDAWIEALPESA